MAASRIPEIPRDRSLTDDELEAAVIYCLLHSERYGPFQASAEGMFDRLGINDGSEKGRLLRINGDAQGINLRILMMLWRWVTAGLIVPQGSQFLVTPKASELLERQADEAEVVLQRSGLVNRLKERCPGLDSVTARYAAFAQESFLAGHYQAAGVMIGVASESALLIFVPRCEGLLKKLGIASPRRTNDNAVHLLRWIDDVIQSHRNPLVGAINAVGSENWLDDLPGLLGIATGIRLTRNEAGHPSPHVVSRDECRNMLGLFPRLAEALFVSTQAFDRVLEAR
jgi:hypothetical protein